MIQFSSRVQRSRLFRSAFCSAAVLAVALSASFSGTANAAYPDKPINILCWSKAGSSVDLYARLLAKLSTKSLGQPLVVTTKAGGGGVVAVNALLSEPADGYTLLAVTRTLTTKFGEPGVTFKATDLQPVVRSELDPIVFMVPGSSPFKNINDLIKFAKANPMKLKVAGAFAIGLHRVAWEGFAEHEGIKATWVPYEGSAPVVASVAGGHVDAAAINPGVARAQVKAGKIRILAAASDQPLRDFPNVPTLKKLGINYTAYQWRGIMVKAGTPKAVVDKLAAAFHKAEETKEWKDFLAKESQMDGFEGPVAFAKTYNEAVQQMAEVKKSLGL